MEKIFIKGHQIQLMHLPNYCFENEKLHNEDNLDFSIVANEADSCIAYLFFQGFKSIDSLKILQMDLCCLYDNREIGKYLLKEGLMSAWENDYDLIICEQQSCILEENGFVKITFAGNGERSFLRYDLSHKAEILSDAKIVTQLF